MTEETIAAWVRWLRDPNRSYNPNAYELLADVLEKAAAARDVLAERQRQISAEGWTPEHDDGHDEGEMCFAAAGYAVVASDHLQAIARRMDDELSMDDAVSSPAPCDPWPAGWTFKTCAPRRALVKAGALILAELERIDRAALAAQGGA